MDSTSSELFTTSMSYEDIIALNLLMKEEHRSMNTSKVSTNDLITIVVGPEKRTFYLRESVICRSSKFFRAACSGSWRKSSDKTINLPDVDHKIFFLYKTSLISNVITLRNLGFDIVQPKTAPRWQTHKIYDTIVAAYIFGDMVLDVGFRDTLIDAASTYHRSFLWVPSADAVRKLCYEVPRNSKLRLLFTMIWLRVDARQWCDEIRKSLPSV